MESSRATHGGSDSLAANTAERLTGACGFHTRRFTVIPEPSRLYARSPARSMN
jgi:outer membrane lipopolysaccharide assembly protein LptE/RlpB